jgi:SAM-dependent methyltransferase
LTHYDEQRRFFEHLSRRYDSRFLRSRWPRNQLLKAGVISDALGSAIETGPVAEVGCGTGQIAEFLLDANPRLEYVGLDLSESMLAIARQRLARFGDRVELKLVEGPLGLPSGRYAGMFGVDVLHHVDEPVLVLGEIRDGLRPGGPVVFLEPNPRFPITTVLGIFEKEERNVLKVGFRNLRHWFEEAKLENVRVSYGALYTPPGPPALVPVFDRVDSALAKVPILRAMTIFFTARGRAPTVND